MDSRSITIQDIANSARVSKSTVSRVLNQSASVNEKKREAVLKAMKKLNYQPNFFARGLAGGQSMTVGVVTQNIGSPFYDSVTQGVIQGLSGSKYVPVFVDGQWQRDVEQRCLVTLMERHVDGIIIVGGTQSEEAIAQIRQVKPVIMVARRISSLGKYCISFDNREAAKKATEYLIQFGHRHIAMIRGIREHEDSIERYRGYLDALQQAGIEPNDDLIIDGNFDAASGVLAVESLISRGNLFSAIFAANDEMAFGARLALYRRGIRVPEDISLMGFDDQPNSAFTTPPLTTIRQPAVSMGQAAAAALLRLLAGEEIESPSLPSEIVVRESVRPMR